MTVRKQHSRSHGHRPASAALTRPPHRSRAVAWMGAMSMALVSFFQGGCETIAQDFNDIGNALSMPSPVEAAQMMFDQHNPDNRRRGTLLLSNSDFGGDDVYLVAYRDMVGNENDPLVLAAAIQALSRHGEPDDAPAVAAHLDHENKHVRWAAAAGLQRLHNPAVVGSLVATLGDEADDGDVRAACATALGQYPQDSVFQGLVAALDARELAINREAQQSLHTLTGHTGPTERAQWLQWYGQLQANGVDPFADQQDFLYPVYSRSLSWWEHIAFWANRPRETSAPPAGLQSDQARTTYDDDDEGANPPDQTGADDSEPSLFP